ncbi:MAG: hypothetical protein H6Q89_1234 [Myxococcaceae bacterium]|nr:hypothetical protein [Myxococcaceae bacterium]
MSTFDERASARSRWPVLRTTLNAPEAPALLDGTAAWDAVMELTWEAYSLADQMPDPLPRAKWPTRLFRPGEQRADSHGL